MYNFNLRHFPTTQNVGFDKQSLLITFEILIRHLRVTIDIHFSINFFHQRDGGQLSMLKLRLLLPYKYVNGNYFCSMFNKNIPGVHVKFIAKYNKALLNV